MSEKSIVQLFDLADRVAIVTGAGGGIGLGIARRLAEAGAAVVLNDVDGARARAAASRLRGRGYSALETVTGDVSSSEGSRTLVEAAVERFGRVDILVNNAGIYPTAPFLEHGTDLWDRVVDTNLRGAFLCAQAVARQFEKQGRGQAILNIASVVGIVGSGPSAAAYAASKGGLLALTKTLARAVGPYGARANAIAPAAIETEGQKGMLDQAAATRQPVGRFGTPDDVALAALYLVAPASDYVTGEILVVDGGYLLMQA
ncbi:MAG: glucose 1-dehydrogenase [Chloroflexi bacterium]|nr:glucose 1-dehydrogenase [Chloroflexota bacterium]